MSSLLRKRSTRVALGAAVLIGLLIAVLSTAARFVGGDVVLPNHAAPDPQKLAEHNQKASTPPVGLHHRTLDSMLAAASSIEGNRLAPSDVMSFDEFASSTYFDRFPSESDEIFQTDLDEPNPVIACVGCLEMLLDEGASPDEPFAPWARRDAAGAFGFGPLGGSASSRGSGSAGASAPGGGLSGLNPPPGLNGGDGHSGDKGGASEHPGQPSNEPGSNGRGSNENESSGNQGAGSGSLDDDEGIPRGPKDHDSPPVSVPEPTTATLLLLGLGAATVVRRRKRRA